jgi:DNA primase
MNKQQTVEFAKQLGLAKIDSTSRSGWVIARCPFARWRHEKGTDTSPSFGLKVGKDHCHCFSCDWSSSLSDMLYRLAVYAKGNKVAGERIRAADHYLDTEGQMLLTIGRQEDDDDEEVDTIEEWPEWTISNHLPAYAHPYLAARGVPVSVAEIMDFRYDSGRRRLGVPVRDFDMRLMGFHGRDVTGTSSIPYLAYTPKQGGGQYNRPIWLGEHWVDLSKPVLIVESVFDLARALQLYRNTLCPLMAGLRKSKIDRLSEALRIALLFDADKAGQRAAEKMVGGLPDSQFLMLSIPAGYKDPGEMPVDVLEALLGEHLDLDPKLT